MARLIIIGAAGLLACTPATAQDRQTVEQAKDIAAQPARDVGAVKTRVPPLLLDAQQDPYGLDGLRSCDDLAAAIRELNDVLGPDLMPDPDPRRSRRIRVTGGTVAGLIVPFRGVVREVSGAASAQRELDSATDAGIARRGFLRGVYVTRKCRAPI
ncbi:hypothetical protein [Sphingomonas sp.]|uniref:hypothetical protein n=1 Tax=Sphingomonas sp. TaxID=28214 RepID=UPI001B2BA481|nr:hypothetical protein [Sphingomonas sp.]MBO9714183.1 hypothetical protein [Sphingomonas sp.]